MTKNTLAALACAIFAAAPTSSIAVEVDDLPRVVQTLVPPPFVPEHDQLVSGGPKVVLVRLVIEEKRIEIDTDPSTIRRRPTSKPGFYREGRPARCSTLSSNPVCTPM